MVDEPYLKEAMSIFSEQEQTAQFMKSMRDLASFASVLKELGVDKMYDSPAMMIRLLRILQFVYEASIGIGEPIVHKQELANRYQARFGAGELPTEREIARIMTALEDNHWLVKQVHQLKLTDRGQRLLDGFVRMGNDALAYYTQEDTVRQLFQAKRVAEISTSYDDAGISAGQTLATMITYLEEATTQLEERQLELLADRHTLPQLERIDALMQEVDEKLRERLSKLGDDTPLDIVQRGEAVLARGTALSAGLLMKYTRFVEMQHTSLADKISQEKMRSFIIQMYTQERPNTPTAHDILSFMEQNLHEDEMLDGLWVPVKFAAPITAVDIKGAVDYLQDYEPKLTEAPPAQVEPVYEEVALETCAVQDVLQATTWNMTKSLIDTKQVESYLCEQDEPELEQLMVEASSNKWHDAVLSLLAVSALTSNRKISETEKLETKTFDKQWEWINDDDKRYTVRKYVHDDESY